MTWSQDNTHFLYGVLDTTNVVQIPIEEIKLANAKMIELKYEKEINSNLYQIVYNDSIIISTMQDTINGLVKKENELINKNKKVKKQRNILAISNGVTILILILILI